MNATSSLVYPGPTRTHRHPCHVHRSPNGRYATLLGWAETPEIAEAARRDFETSEPVDLEDLIYAGPEHTDGSTS